MYTFKGDKFTAEIKFLQTWNPAMKKKDGSAYRLFQGNVLDSVSIFYLSCTGKNIGEDNVHCLKDYCRDYVLLYFPFSLFPTARYREKKVKSIMWKL